MREPRFELGSPRWQREILTTELLTHIKERIVGFKKIVNVFLVHMTEQKPDYREIPGQILMTFLMN